MRGVILDLASLGPADVDLAPLSGALDSWELHDATPAGQVAARIRDAEVVLSNKVPLTEQELKGAGRLRLVLVMASGTNNVDLAAAARLGICVCNVRGYATPSVAQHTLLLMLALARSLGPLQESASSGEWSRSPFFCVLGHPLFELQQRRLGIVGYGELGREVARLAGAFGMDIALAEMPGRRYGPAQDHPRMALPELLAWADMITLHCPLEASTRGLIGAAELALMRPAALLINTARGGIVDEMALLEALRAKRIAGAALDTLEVEPPPAGYPLLNTGLPNLIITPHVAWASRESRQRLIDQAGLILAAFREGRTMNRVN